ncbi:MAG: fasciclin domain-containing protein [Chitinophagaceae bacterium]
MSTILQIANNDRNLGLFTKGLKLSGLEAKLNEMGPFTILGPVNLALGKLLALTYEQLLDPSNTSKLVAFLSGYILVGKKMFSDFRNDQQLAALDGTMVLVSNKNSEIHLNGAKVLAHDRQGSNGVVHLLNTTYANK